MLTLILSKLALHYYRPDLTEGQSRQLITDMIEDLTEFAIPDVEAAARIYRQNGKNKFFPTSGALRDLAAANAKDRLAASAPRPRMPESRPILWWWCAVWKPHWREDEIPPDHREAFEIRKRRKGEPTVIA